MKYLKLFENIDILNQLPTVDQLKANIRDNINDNKYFSSHVPYAKKEEQCERLMMIIYHNKNILTHGITNEMLPNYGYRVKEILGKDNFNIIINYIDDAINEAISKIKEPLLNILKTAFTEILLEYVGDKSRKRNKDKNAQVYLEWVDYVPDWVKEIPELQYIRRSKKSGLWDLKK